MALFDNLIYIPCSDLNFKHGIERLSVDDLKSMLEKLNRLQAKCEYHKGRIKAVTRELNKRYKAGILTAVTKPHKTKKEV
jgi:hypothetical protein